MLVVSIPNPKTLGRSFIDSQISSARTNISSGLSAGFNTTQQLRSAIANPFSGSVENVNSNAINTDPESFNTIDGDADFFKTKSNNDYVSYPLDRENLDHWMALRIAKFEFLREQDVQIEKTEKTIFLPIPLGLTTNYGQEWNSLELPLGLNTLVQKAATGNLNLDTLKSEFGSKFKGQTEAPSSSTITAAATAIGKIAGLGGFASAAVGALGAESLESAISAAQGKRINTFESLTYQKPKLRTHAFTWDLIAREPNEAKVINQIIRDLKWHSSPGLGAEGALLTYPHMFDIDFKHEKTLFNIGPSVLTDLSIDYHAEGRPVYALEESGLKSPVSVRITTNFQEIAIVTRETIEKQNR